MYESVPLEYFKCFKFKTEFPKSISGNLIYLREDYEGYNFENGDELDKEIEFFLKDLFIDTQKGYQTVIMPEEQLYIALNKTNGGVCKDIILNFIPKPTCVRYCKLHNTDGILPQSKELRMTFLTDNESSINLIIYDEYNIFVEEICMKRLDTIKKI